MAQPRTGPHAVAQRGSTACKKEQPQYSSTVLCTINTMENSKHQKGNDGKRLPRRRKQPHSREQTAEWRWQSCQKEEEECGPSFFLGRLSPSDLQSKACPGGRWCITTDWDRGVQRIAVLCEPGDESAMLIGQQQKATPPCGNPRA